MLYGVLAGIMMRVDFVLCFTFYDLFVFATSDNNKSISKLVHHEASTYLGSARKGSLEIAQSRRMQVELNQIAACQYVYTRIIPMRPPTNARKTGFLLS